MASKKPANVNTRVDPPYMGRLKNRYDPVSFDPGWPSLVMTALAWLSPSLTDLGRRAMDGPVGPDWVHGTSQLSSIGSRVGSVLV